MMLCHRFRRDLVFLAAAIILLFAHGSGVSNAQESLAKDSQSVTFVYLPLVAATVRQPTVHSIAIDHAIMDFYIVEGANEDEMRAYMNAVRPGDYDALTEWQFQWFVPDDGNGSCNLDGVTVEYTITVIFPQWTPSAEATAALIQKWNGYIDALALHESGHVERVVPHVPDLVNDIKASTCESFNEAGQAWLNDIDQLNSDYDAETNHGATQGAVFP
jgi:predicted secreted Zn-dependent protease